MTLAEPEKVPHKPIEDLSEIIPIERLNERQAKFISLWVETARRTDHRTTTFLRSCWLGAGYSDYRHWRKDAKLLERKLWPNIKVDLYDMVHRDVPRAYERCVEIAFDKETPKAVALKAVDRILSLGDMDSPKKIEITTKTKEQYTEKELDEAIKRLHEKLLQAGSIDAVAEVE